MADYLLLQKNSRQYLLVRYPKRYHMITVDNHLTDEYEEKVLSGGCSDAVIDEMGLTRFTILESNLRGVSIGGSRAGDVVVLYTKEKKHRFVLSDDYSAEELDAFFTGIHRFQAPKSKSSGSRNHDWRSAKQNQTAAKVLAPVGIVLNCAGVLSFIGAAVFGNLSPVWAVLNLVLLIVSLTLYLFFPQYYSIMGEKEYKKAGYTAKVTHIWLAVGAPAMGLVFRTLGDFSFPDWTQIGVACVVAGLSAAVVLLALSREVRDHGSLLLIVALLSVFFAYGVVAQINHLFNLDPEGPVEYTVIDTECESSSKSADRYYCIVELESGEEMKIPISASAYQNLLPGETVQVYIGEGGLGIEYAYYIQEG